MTQNTASASNTNDTPDTADTKSSSSQHQQLSRPEVKSKFKFRSRISKINSLNPKLGRPYNSNTLNELASPSRTPTSRSRDSPQHKPIAAHRKMSSISVSTEFIKLTPPHPDEVIREERRLSNASMHSRSASISDNAEHDNHLLLPPEQQPEDAVNKLISERRASTITSLHNTPLAHLLKQIFIDKKIKEDGVPSRVVEGVYLGSVGAAKNLEWMKRNGITHVLCVAGGIGACFPKQFTYKVVDIDDAPNEDISAHFQACYAYIEEAIAGGGKVLVHCFAGVSRSVTVTAAYLMQKRNMYALRALKLVQKHRVQANPNAGFIVQLIKFQKVIGLAPKNNDLDMPTNSSDDDVTDAEEEKSDQPRKKKNFKSLVFAVRDQKKMETAIHMLKHEQPQNADEKHDGNATAADGKTAVEADVGDGKQLGNEEEEDPHKSLTNHLNTQMVEEWETGRRPSIFTAIARLRGLKRPRSTSNDSVRSNLSVMSADTSEKSPKMKVLAPDYNTHPSPSSLATLAKLQLLKEVSDETKLDETDVVDEAIAGTGNKSNLLGALKPDADSGDDENEPITPMESFEHEQFPAFDASTDDQKHNAELDL